MHARSQYAGSGHVAASVLTLRFGVTEEVTLEAVVLDEGNSTLRAARCCRCCPDPITLTPQVLVGSFSHSSLV